MAKSGHSHDHHHGQSHNHGHHHGHSHGHSHGQVQISGQASTETLKRLRLAFWLNFSFAFIELVGGLLVNSVSILSDAVHDFGDALALGLSLYFEKRSHDRSNATYSYGFRRLSAGASLITGFILVTGSVTVMYHAAHRFFEPVAPHSLGMLGLAVVGLAVNGYAALKTSAGCSLNERVVTWHLMEDVMGWALVLVGSLFIYFLEWNWVDPLLAILLGVWVCWNVRRPIFEGLQIFLQGVPLRINVQEVEAELKRHAEISACHHTHIWSLDGDSHILTTHLVVQADTPLAVLSKLKSEIKKNLKEKFQITEATIEFEAVGEHCFDPEHQI